MNDEDLDDLPLEEATLGRKLVTLPASGFRLGAWIAPSHHRAPLDCAVRMIDAVSSEISVSVGLSRRGIPIAGVRLTGHEVRLLAAERVAQMCWTRVELVAVQCDDTDRPFEVALWVDGVEVDRAWLAAGLSLECTRRTVDIGISETGEILFGWFVGVLGTVWLWPLDRPCRAFHYPSPWTIASRRTSRDGESSRAAHVHS